MQGEFRQRILPNSSCRDYQINGGSDLVGDHLVGIRPSNVTANALRAGFHLVAHRALPLPVGSSDRVAR